MRRLNCPQNVTQCVRTDYRPPLTPASNTWTRTLLKLGVGEAPAAVLASTSAAERAEGLDPAVGQTGWPCPRTPQAHGRTVNHLQQAGGLPRRPEIPEAT